jgi:hypothetical protein
MTLSTKELYLISVDGLYVADGHRIIYGKKHYFLASIEHVEAL